ncbi:hypothetical protein ACTXT7_014138 [Hymenolepis weldensis]
MADSNTGLSSGELAAAIAVPIIVVVLAAVAVGLYFFFRKRRAKFGSYNPNEQEIKTGNSEGQGTTDFTLVANRERQYNLPGNEACSQLTSTIEF